MSCNHFQHQLSECLDGRLPAGSRTVVMAHVATCADCARVWDEMQRVQDLVLSLPAQRTSRDFRDSLWSRINAGEGAPQVDFHEPLPLWAKMRYVLAGAAAAAALLFAGRFLLKADPPAAPRHDEIAAVRTSEDSRGTPLHKRESPDPLLDELHVFTPQNVVSAIAASTESQAHALRARLCGQEPVPQAVYDQPDIQRAVMQLSVSTNLMRWLKTEGVLHFPPNVEADMRLLEISIEAVERSRDPRTLSAALCSLERMRIENLAHQVFVPAVSDQGEFLREFKIQLDRDPRAARMIRLEFAPAESGGTGFFWIARKLR